MDKIKKFSRFFRILFQFFFILLPIIYIGFWGGYSFWHANFPNWFGFFSTYFIPHSVEILHQVSGKEAFYAFLAGILPTAVIMFLLFFLIKLFKLYEQGEIFSRSNVKVIRNIGIMMLIEQFVGLIHEPLMGLILTIHNPPGHRLASVSFDNYNVNYIITAVMIILVSWIMNEAAKLQEEQKLTV